MQRTVSTSHSHSTKLRLPKRILLVRHGQSLGNVDEEAYHTIPDWLIPITDVGVSQAREMGQKIKKLIGNDPIYIYYSPYLRTRQTMIHMMESLHHNPIYGIREEPRITEQQFGNFQNNDMGNYKKEKNSFGRFYYRYPDGESGLDVYNRVTSFIGSLFREWYSHTADEEFRNTNVIIVTHGLSLRLFIMRWFHFTVHQFEQSMNPGNADIIVMERITQCIPHPPQHPSHTSSSHTKRNQNRLGSLSEEVIRTNFTSSSLLRDRDGKEDHLSSTRATEPLVEEEEEEEYILDLHPVSSYEKVELSRFIRSHLQQNQENHNSNEDHLKNTHFQPHPPPPTVDDHRSHSNPHFHHLSHQALYFSHSEPPSIHRQSPRPISARSFDPTTFTITTGNQSSPDIKCVDNLEEDEVFTNLPHPVENEDLDVFECFVLTKTSQEMLNFHIPRKSQQMQMQQQSRKKYFHWQEYNQIYKLEQEVEEDVQSIVLCPEKKLSSLKRHCEKLQKLSTPPRSYPKEEEK